MAKKTIDEKTSSLTASEVLKDEASETKPLKGKVASETKPLEGEVVNRVLTKKEIMKAKLDAQPKVKIIIPKGEKEPAGAFETVQLNGYTYQIKKGVYVEVPEQIANIIMDSNKQINDALETAARRLADNERPEFDNSSN